MTVLSHWQVVERVKAGQLLIEPFDEKLLSPASYDLRLGRKILASPLSKDILGAIVELNDRSPTYRIQSGQMVAVISLERLQLPLDVAGRFGIRSDFARRGINAFGGLQLDPGFDGHLILGLLNVGPEPVAITLGEALFSVEFNKLDRPATVGYAGPHQNQEDFPQDQYDYILNARTTSLAEIPTLRQEVARLNVLIEQLEERLPDPDEGYDLRPEIEQQLRRSLELGKEQLLTAEQVWQQFSG